MATSTNSMPHSLDLVRPAAEKATRQKAATRRGVLGVLGAAAMAAPALAATEELQLADPLEAMWEQAQALDKKFMLASQAASAAQGRAEELHPAPPSSLVRNGRPMRRDELVREIATYQVFSNREHQEAAARWGLRLRLHDHWHAKCDAIDEAYKVKHLDDAASEAMSAMFDALDEIDRTAAQTSRGVLVKLRAAHRRWGYNKKGQDYDFVPDAGRILSVLADLERIA